MDIYREIILDHWRNPQNFGKLAKADLIVEQVNPLCGDEVTFFFKFGDKKPFGKTQGKQETGNRKPIANGEKRIADVRFTGSGCAISIASASMLSEAIKGKSVDTISKITGEDIFGLIGGPVSPARLKCAFLSLEAVRKLML